MTYIIAFILFCLAVAFNAVSDTLMYRFNESVFRNLNKQFWNPQFSWTNKYVGGKVELGHKTIKVWVFRFKFPDALSDAWHISKTLMIFSLCGSLAALTPIWWVSFIITGISWNLIFNILFDTVLTNRHDRL